MELVVFTDTNARILKNPDMTSRKAINPHLTVMIDPKRAPELNGVPPHYWKPDFSTNTIVPMSASEKKLRDSDIAKLGVCNDLSATPTINVHRKVSQWDWKKSAALAAAAATAGTLFYFLV